MANTVIALKILKVIAGELHFSGFVCESTMDQAGGSKHTIKPAGGARAQGD
jgi:hypothetical protein